MSTLPLAAAECAASSTINEAMALPEISGGNPNFATPACPPFTLPSFEESASFACSAAPNGRADLTFKGRWPAFFKGCLQD
ncbi:MAG: hypothetical protein GY822_00215 [Deltaproteobacteria bacterium]|nr:hypothetical protein [Deltaproteobacteria bacterium]